MAEGSPWLDLKQAAEYLGVHFTTLRRWADQGQVPCIRTPGGRRRFNRGELALFLASLHEGEHPPQVPSVTTTPTPTISFRHPGVAEEPWYQRLSENERSAMRQEGQQLMAVLMQYSTRTNGGEPFLAEGRRLAAHYGVACRRTGLTLVETVRTFLMVRRTIKDSVYQAGALAGAPDSDTWRLYDRMNTFLDSMLLAIVESYEQTPGPSLPSSSA